MPSGCSNSASATGTCTPRSTGGTVATMPDLICVLDSGTSDPVTTEGLRYGLRYGLRVSVIAARHAPPAGSLRTGSRSPVPAASGTRWTIRPPGRPPPEPSRRRTVAV
ncbi:hypothetical protein ACFVXC_15880 [Streptomyces sp. NPDC058257]|uniref:S-methyl thiohydantoin desulfurase domain-containing protein n=1 Tax=Streptomyces sp. NPDC058257 TaxID=3346409 RepID=UPI0036E6B6B1